MFELHGKMASTRVQKTCTAGQECCWSRVTTSTRCRCLLHDLRCMTCTQTVAYVASLSRSLQLRLDASGWGTELVASMQNVLLKRNVGNTAQTLVQHYHMWWMCYGSWKGKLHCLCCLGFMAVWIACIHGLFSGLFSLCKGMDSSTLVVVYTRAAVQLNILNLRIG